VTTIVFKGLTHSSTRQWRSFRARNNGGWVGQNGCSPAVLNGQKETRCRPRTGLKAKLWNMDRAGTTERTRGC